MFENKLMEKLATHTELSFRECEVVLQVSLGKTNKQAGEELFITEKTVKFHLSKVFKKLGIKSSKQLVVYAMNLILAGEIEARFLPFGKAA